VVVTMAGMFRARPKGARPFAELCQDVMGLPGGFWRASETGRARRLCSCGPLTDPPGS